MRKTISKKVLKKKRKEKINKEKKEDFLKLRFMEET